jgi:hypothetical protein
MLSIGNIKTIITFNRVITKRIDELRTIDENNKLFKEIYVGNWLSRYQRRIIAGIPKIKGNKTHPQYAEFADEILSLIL